MQELRVYPKIIVKTLQKSRSMLSQVKSRESLYENFEDQDKESNQSLIELEDKRQFASKVIKQQKGRNRVQNLNHLKVKHILDKWYQMLEMDFVINQRDKEQPQVGDLKILRQYKLCKNMKNQSSSEQQLIPCYQQNNSLLTPNYKYQERCQDKKIDQKKNLQGIQNGQSDAMQQEMKFQERNAWDSQGEILEQKENSAFVKKNFQTLQKQIQRLRNSKQKDQNLLVPNENKKIEESLENLSSIELA